MTRNPCPKSKHRTGAHDFAPIEDGTCVKDNYLGGWAAKHWACTNCGKAINFDGRYAIAPQARRS